MMKQHRHSEKAGLRRLAQDYPDIDESMLPELKKWEQQKQQLKLKYNPQCKRLEEQFRALEKEHFAKLKALECAFEKELAETGYTSPQDFIRLYPSELELTRREAIEELKKQGWRICHDGTRLYQVWCIAMGESRHKFTLLTWCSKDSPKPPALPDVCRKLQNQYKFDVRVFYKSVYTGPN